MGKRLRVFGAILFIIVGGMVGLDAYMMGTTPFQARQHSEDVDITLAPGETFLTDFWSLEEPITAAHVQVTQSNISVTGNVSVLAIPQAWVNGDVIKQDTNMTDLQGNFSTFDVQVKLISGSAQLLYTINLSYPLEHLTIILTGTNLQTGIPNSMPMRVSLFIWILTTLTTESYWMRWGFLEISLIMTLLGCVVGLVLVSRKD